jgi:hypothetical protein
VAESSGLGAEQGQVRARARAKAAYSLESQKWQGCLEVISSIFLPLGPGIADGILPAEGPGKAALSRNENSPAVTCKVPRSSSQLSWKLHGQRGMCLRVCREPVPSPGGVWAAGLAGAVWPPLGCSPGLQNRREVVISILWQHKLGRAGIEQVCLETEGLDSMLLKSTERVREQKKDKQFLVWMVLITM